MFRVQKILDSELIQQLFRETVFLNTSLQFNALCAIHAAVTDACIFSLKQL
jgi:hypothetical protein